MLKKLSLIVSMTGVLFLGVSQFAMADGSLEECRDYCRADAAKNLSDCRRMEVMPELRMECYIWARQQEAICNQDCTAQFGL